MDKDEKKFYQIVSSKKTQIGRFEIIYDMIDRNGIIHPYSYVDMRPAVGILGFVGDSVILLHQYRYIWDEWMWEVPGGMIDVGETPEEAAIREMEEESGFHVKRIKYLGVCYPSIGATKEIQYLFYVECDKQIKQKLDSLERIKATLVPIDEFKRMMRDHEFNHGMGLAAWAYYSEMDTT